MIDLTARPVSAKLCELLEADIHRHQIVVWIDLAGHYTQFVDDLRGSGGWVAPVLAHRGSYLELMVELEHHAGGVDESPVLIHLPGPLDVKSTPMLEISCAGKQFRKALDSLIREAAVGRVGPAQVDEFLAGPDVTLASADAWMAARVSAASGELAAKLQGMSIMALAAALLDHGSPLARQLAGATDFPQLWQHLEAHLGLPAGWTYPVARKRVTTAVQAGEALASWALCVEYVHDLRRDAIAEVLRGIHGSLEPALLDACCAVARSLRDTAEDAYEALALDVERLIDAEARDGQPGDLGKIDTFRFEEQQLCVGALDALDASDWAHAAQWARERLDGKSFWIRRDAARKNAWNLIAATAALGQAVAGARLEYRTADSLADATARYVERGASVDRRQRELAQRTEELLFDRVPHVARLRAAIEHARGGYVVWQDQRAREWSALCEREGALPAADLQQRQIFDDVVRPLLDDEKTVLFMVDALRFEMATELLELLGPAAAPVARLRPRLAELPSVTEVGMNVLAPIAQGGQLRPLLAGKDKAAARRFDGFATANFQVKTREQRKKAMATRAGGAACPSFVIEDLLRMTSAELHLSLRQARLALVLSDQIDAAGEKGIGTSVFSTELLRIRAAWQLLREAGVNRFVITSDHGFMLREKGDPTISHGQGYDALARYALYPVPVNNADQLSISLRSLQYEDVDGYLLFARGAAVYECAKDRNFVHGGNSPQERIIPVLTLEHKNPAGASDRRYDLVIEEKGSIDGMHFVQAKLQIAAGQKGLAFAEPSSVDFDVRVVDDARVQAHTNQAGLGAEMRGGVVHTRVGRSFRLLFRLAGPREARVQIELFHPSGTQTIEPQLIDRRFEVTEAKPEPPPVAVAAAPASTSRAPVKPPAPVVASDAWLDGYADPGVRKVFAHIAEFGAINEGEATAMLGSGRAFRHFSGKFEALAELAPFAVAIDPNVTPKRYVRRNPK